MYSIMYECKNLFVRRLNNAVAITKKKIFCANLISLKNEFFIKKNVKSFENWKLKFFTTLKIEESKNIRFIEECKKLT